MANVSSSNGLEKRPKLRFPGFDEPWEEKKLDELLSPRVEKQIPSEEAPLMAFTAEGGVEPKGERYDRSYLVKSDDKLYKRTEFNDFIYSSNNLDVGSIGLNKYGTAVISDVYEIFRVKPDNSPTFMSELIQRPHNIAEILKYRQGCLYGQYRIYAEDFLNVSVLVPTKLEQEKVSQFFDALDHRIEHQASLIKALKKYKRGVFEAIFSRTLRLMPRSSQSSWKVFKLSDFATRITRKNNGATDIPLTISSQYGLIDQRDFFSKVVASTDMSGYYLLHRGEYAYNRSTSNDYPFGSIKRLDLYDKGAVSTLYLCFSIKEEVVLSDFAKWYFESSQWYRGVNEICAEGARNHGLLNVPTDGFLIQSIYSQVILKNRLKSPPSFHEFMTSLPMLKKS